MQNKKGKTGEGWGRELADPVSETEYTGCECGGHARTLVVKPGDTLYKTAGMLPMP